MDILSRAASITNIIISMNEEIMGALYSLIHNLSNSYLFCQVTKPSFARRDSSRSA